VRKNGNIVDLAAYLRD